MANFKNKDERSAKDTLQDFNIKTPYILALKQSRQKYKKLSNLVSLSSHLVSLGSLKYETAHPSHYQKIAQFLLSG